MTKKSPKTTTKGRQNPWYKNQVSSLDGRHSRLAEKVRALKAFANSTEVALRETQQELIFAIDAIRELVVRVKHLETITLGVGIPLNGKRPTNNIQDLIEDPLK